MNRSNRSALDARWLWGTVMALGLMGATAASAGVELIPSFGMSRAVDNNSGDAKTHVGLALRAPLLPFLAAQGDVSYREQQIGGSPTKMRIWPVTASLWLTPVPALYLGGGVGWYRTTLDFSEGSAFNDQTSMQLGTHVGGGLDIPLAQHLGLDVNGRYVFMQENKDLSQLQLPEKFNPDFWSTSLGLAIKF